MYLSYFRPQLHLTILVGVASIGPTGTPRQYHDRYLTWPKLIDLTDLECLDPPRFASTIT